MTSPQIRVAFVGNVANFSYRVAKALRAATDFDVHLYFNSDVHIAMRPESDDPELTDHYPPWIHPVPVSVFRKLVYRLLLPFLDPLIAELKTFDIIIVCDIGPIHTQFTGKPYCFLVMGGDASLTPFPRRYRFLSNPSVLRLLARMALAYWQRRGIRHADEIWVQPFKPYVNPLLEMGTAPERIRPVYFPMIVDTERFKPAEASYTGTDPNLPIIAQRFDFVVFHPARLQIAAHPLLQAAGQWKANDVLIRGFAQFAKSNTAARPGLVMPDISMSKDIPLARALVSELGIEPNVYWAKAPRPHAFTREELKPYYLLADVVGDDFGVGWFGGVVLEGLAFGRPVLNYIDEQVMQQLYPWHPILSARTSEEVAAHLQYLYYHPEEKQRIGARGRQWVEQFHAPRNAASVYVHHIKEVVERYAQTAPAR